MQRMNVIETERLILRRIGEADAPFVLELLNEPAWIENIGDRGVRTTGDAVSYIADAFAQSYERFGFGLYLVELKESGVSVGICGLVKREQLENVDVGFAFLERFWRRGFAFESASAVIAHARDTLDLKRLAAITVAENAGSINVLEKTGFRFEKTLKLAEDADAVLLFVKEL